MPWLEHSNGTSGARPDLGVAVARGHCLRAEGRRARLWPDWCQPWRNSTLRADQHEDRSGTHEISVGIDNQTNPAFHAATCTLMENHGERQQYSVFRELVTDCDHPTTDASAKTELKPT
jgi:hypothetical protein